MWASPTHCHNPAVKTRTSSYPLATQAQMAGTATWMPADVVVFFHTLSCLSPLAVPSCRHAHDVLPASSLLQRKNRPKYFQALPFLLELGCSKEIHLGAHGGSNNDSKKFAVGDTLQPPLLDMLQGEVVSLFPLDIQLNNFNLNPMLLGKILRYPPTEFLLLRPLKT